MSSQGFFSDYPETLLVRGLVESRSSPATYRRMRLLRAVSGMTLVTAMGSALHVPMSRPALLTRTHMLPPAACAISGVRMMCNLVDKTVVERCQEKIEEKLSPQVLPTLATRTRSRDPRAQLQAACSVICACKIALQTLPAQALEVKGAFDDPNGSHIAIMCVSEAFEGKRSLARQQMVFKAIWDEMQGQGGAVHAVDQMVLKAPSEV